ncbi:LysM peptidoglycan-binding domain-containing protein [Oceanobacillus sp. J11TS1]|uniref:LysM peptidoglycan-binding domain-containing protein n=1 Tax=Oceanobacillus sp. J11TS1 TaxID=2807191 RepID=UPI001B176172|nr:glycoside hydrolase family 18 protein [Oceanobacillus sp. J11TS1]GIO24277.1 spore germination protein YaaH [Oceanobacillus sp. J11TS1]
MQIYVVQQGDTLDQIAATYGSSVQDIINANELNAPNQLVIGQALVIPIIGEFYFVQPGDTLSSVAARFNISVEELATVNGMNANQIIYPGFRLYIPPGPKEPITSNAYIEPMGEEVSQTLETAARNYTPFLTYLGLFSYRINRDGTLTAPPTGNLIQTARENGASIMMSVTNLEGGEFSTEVGHIILTVQAVQNRLLDEIINIATEQGFRDVHFDLEFLPPEDREAYNRFLRTAKDRLSQAGLLISTALAPKTSAEQSGQLYEAHDYQAHGEIVDMVVIMTYEWGYSYGPPMAVSPVNSVREVVEYAVSEIPPEKILLGQNLYGYDWTLPFVQGGEAARAVSPQQAIQIAWENNVAIQYDNQAQAPYFTYTDTSGQEHEVWFEDARSIQAKFDLIREFQLLGISYWKLGLAFPQNWLLLNDQFNIRKLEEEE